MQPYESPGDKVPERPDDWTEELPAIGDDILHPIPKGSEACMLLRPDIEAVLEGAITLDEWERRSHIGTLRLPCRLREHATERSIPGHHLMIKNCCIKVIFLEGH